MSLPTKSVLADDVEIVRRVLAHIDAGTTDEGAAWREPVENYVSASRFEEEIRLLRAMPSVFVPSAAIPAPGDHVERVVFGVPLFAVRGHDQRARVFRNACRHRGFALVEEPGCSHALVCRYHGWTYRLDGSLAHVPHPEAFPGLDAAGRGLVEVHSREVDGLIVIDPLDSSGIDTGEAMAALTDGNPWRDKLLPAERMVYVDSTVRAMNWKVLVEQFLEGYHLRSTHRDTFYPVQYDDLNVVEIFGPNSRLTFPYRNIERLRDRPESRWNVDARVTYVYQLFPNVMVATFPGVVSVVAIDPVDACHTTVSTYSMVKPEVAERASVDPAAKLVGTGSFIERGLAEDNQMSAGVQRGLHAGANEFVEFGRHESAAGHFHAVLDERLARMATATAF
ncbi:SRPBCC family protein [Mycobacterium sp. E3198]|uniref:aromatic ring-hydroxylating oxygenase subunit alpha n=1 Tax=Mycobacterium sp. E3198 TaxID=1834143 RepID=UPI0008005F83|nr:SRPBCC family protein [Mycobacterium sp. E3198]OBG31317.1 ring-hydroxylating oxygenase subunit alpha [Mycobacterium sp. E3198]